MLDDERLKPRPGRGGDRARWVRFRTLGCYPLSGAIESEAATIAELIAEMRTGRRSERQGRLIDRDGDGRRWSARRRRAISDGPSVIPAKAGTSGRRLGGSPRGPGFRRDDGVGPGKA